MDGRVAWIGGHYVGDEYLGKNKKLGHWRDTHVRIEGPAVLEPVGMLQSVVLTMKLKIMLDCNPETRRLALMLGPNPE